MGEKNLKKLKFPSIRSLLCKKKNTMYFSEIDFPIKKPSKSDEKYTIHVQLRETSNFSPVKVTISHTKVSLKFNIIY
jgi:hypothetical protein